MENEIRDGTKVIRAETPNQMAGSLVGMEDPAKRFATLLKLRGEVKRGASLSMDSLMAVDGIATGGLDTVEKRVANGILDIYVAKIPSNRSVTVDKLLNAYHFAQKDAHKLPILAKINEIVERGAILDAGQLNTLVDFHSESRGSVESSLWGILQTHGRNVEHPKNASHLDTLRFGALYERQSALELLARRAEAGRPFAKSIVDQITAEATGSKSLEPAKRRLLKALEENGSVFQDRKLRPLRR